MAHRLDGHMVAFRYYGVWQLGTIFRVVGKGAWVDFRVKTAPVQRRRWISPARHQARLLGASANAAAGAHGYPTFGALVGAADFGGTIDLSAPDFETQALKNTVSYYYMEAHYAR